MSPFRFRKRLRILPGVHLNLSRRWPPSVSVGPRGLQFNSRTRRVSADLPGPVNYQTRSLGGPRMQGPARPVSWSWLLGVVAVGVLGWAVVALFGWPGLWSALRWGW